ncbi:hypothetical protein TWF192_004557 [Orbilia oligospora]|uniref:alpha-L-rhamnosidase n=1 Tax=Orbilia oligospora TaxID=2813651 RepID=A0A6G1MAQ4_ORBOL|nr:hypothetical protein TWF191_011361 [Orbilia oligospora]KAF3252104.1 hypothetical protein TWF192_004557 [Orbilia oligospora]
MAPSIEITNLRLPHTSNLLGIDDPTPIISWSYSIPSSQTAPSWQQITYILSLRNWSLASGPDSAKTYVVVGPRGYCSGNILWPKVFPRVESSHVYELSVRAIFTGGQTNVHGEFGSPDGDKLAPEGESAEQLAAKFTVGLSDASIASGVLIFEGGIVGGLNGWYKKAPSITPITTPWSAQGWEKPEPVPAYRNTYTLNSKPQFARVYATGFGVYKIFINGKAVSAESTMNPGWTEYAVRITYQTYDITEHLQAGDNVVTVWVADGWYRGRLGLPHKRWSARRGIYGKETGFMALFEIFGSENKSFWTGSSDETGWKCIQRSPILETEIYDGEHHDARISIETAREDEWKDVKQIPEVFVSELRRPVINEKTVNWRILKWDIESWSTETATKALQAQTAPLIRHTQTFPLKETIRTPKGKIIWDFAQNITGKIKIKGSAPAGTKLTFLHVEILDQDGEACWIILRGAKATDSYTFSGNGVEEWEPEFTFHGFRYVQVDGLPEGVEIEAVAKVYGSDCDKGLLKFNSTHRDLNRFVENIQWSTRGNFYSVPTDCPQRDERLGWSGDINLFGPTAVYIFDCYSFLKQWLQGLADGLYIGGFNRPPIVSPNAFELPGSHRPMAIWEDCLVALPWNLYKQYRDPSLLEALYPSIRKYYTKGIPRNEDGLWVDSFQYGDWLDPTTPPERPELAQTNQIFIADTWLCNISQIILNIATVLGKTEDVELFKSSKEKVISAWQKKYLVAIDTSISESEEPQQLIRWEPNAEDPNPPNPVPDSQTAYSCAITFGLLPENYIEPAIRRLHHLVKNKADFHISTGLAGTPEIFYALCYPRNLPSTTSQEHLESVSLAYKLLLKNYDTPSFLYPIKLGATSIWERWDCITKEGFANVVSMTSMNHYALGAPGKWIFENIGGIKLEHDDLPVSGVVNADAKKGWKFIFDPIPSVEFGVLSNQMEYESPKGRVECRWSYNTQDKELSVEVAVPANCEGEIRIIGKTVQKVGAGNYSVKKKLDEVDWKTLEAF